MMKSLEEPMSCTKHEATSTALTSKIGCRQSRILWDPNQLEEPLLDAESFASDEALKGFVKVIYLENFHWSCAPLYTVARTCGSTRPSRFFEASGTGFTKQVVSDPKVGSSFTLR
jgi:hypothetical protein